jgi:hypothetical protein
MELKFYGDKDISLSNSYKSHYKVSTDKNLLLTNFTVF